MKIKVLALVLVLLMIIPAITACGDDGKKNDKKRPKDTSTETVSDTKSTASEYAEVEDYVASFAAASNFNGNTFTIIGNQSSPENEEETGDVSNDALYKRGRDLEEKFGIDIIYNIPENGEYTNDNVRNEVMAGGNAYDLVNGNMNTCGSVLYPGALLVDACELEQIDFSREWWMASLEESYGICGKIYFLIGPIVTNFYTDDSCIIFNKQVATDFNIPDMYSMVKDGTWTLDKFMETASAIPANDSSGSGIFRYDALSSQIGVAFLFATGHTVGEFDEEGKPYMPDSVPTTFVDTADITKAFLSDDTQTANVKASETAEAKYGSEEPDFFKDGQALFHFTTTGGAAARRTQDIEFGILPYPKLNVTQKDYYSYCSTWGSGAFFIPKCASNLEMTGTITECLAAMSMKYVKPAYYDTILKGRSVYDFESRDMIDIIFHTAKYNIMEVFSGGNLSSAGELMDTIDRAFSGQKEVSLASTYPSLAKIANRTIERSIKANSK